MHGGGYVGPQGCRVRAFAVRLVAHMQPLQVICALQACAVGGRLQTTAACGFTSTFGMFAVRLNRWAEHRAFAGFPRHVFFMYAAGPQILRDGTLHIAGQRSFRVLSFTSLSLMLAVLHAASPHPFLSGLCDKASFVPSVRLFFFLRSAVPPCTGLLRFAVVLCGFFCECNAIWGIMRVILQQNRG